MMFLRACLLLALVSAPAHSFEPWAPSGELGLSTSPDPEPAAVDTAGKEVSRALRVDLGAHVGSIDTMGVSADGELLATAGADRSLRVWRVDDLKLERSWRLSLPARELLLSPDGRRALTSSMSGGAYDVLLAAAGEEALPPGLSGRALWSFSEDGRSALALDHGCAIDRVPLDGGEAKRIVDFSDIGAWSWLPTALLDDGVYAVACSSDPPAESHAVLLQALGWTGKVEIVAPASGLILDPKATMLAVAQWGRAGVGLYAMSEIKSGKKGVEPIREFSLKEGRTGSLSHLSDLSWPRPHQLRGLYTPDDGDAELIELDPDSGQVNILATGTITAVAWLSEDRVAYGTAEGQLVILDLKSQSGGTPPVLVSVGPPTLAADELWLSPDGAEVGIRLPGQAATGKAAEQRTFSMSKLGFGPPPDKKSANKSEEEEPKEAPLDRNGPCLGWKDQPLEVKGKAACRDPRHFKARRDPEHKSVYVGGEASLERFGRNGDRQWVIPLDVPLVALRPSNDGRFLAARHQDGTIRWYRPEDGVLVAALLVLSDGLRWLAWTEHGYFATSIGAEGLAGWEVERKAQSSADFFSFSRFSAERFRPDVVQAVFAARDEPTALKSLGEAPPAPQALPPVVEILGERQGRLKVRVRSEGPISGWRVLLDGRPLPPKSVRVEKEGKNGERQLKLDTAIAGRDVTVFALSGSLVSEASRWKGLGHASAPQGGSPAGGQGALNVLAVGVSDYALSSLDLRYADRDAMDLSKLLRQQGSTGLYRSVGVRLVTNTEATRGGVEAGLKWLTSSTGPNDVALVFFSGHGETEKHKYYFATHNVDPARLSETALPGEVIIAGLANIQGRVLLLLDTCKSAGLASSSLVGFVNALNRPEISVVVLSSSTADQLSLEHEDWQHGAFTRALLDGLAGKADMLGEGLVSVQLLSAWLSREVGRLTEQAQTPQLVVPGPVGDFTLVKLVSSTDPCAGTVAPRASMDRLEAARCSLVQARTSFPGLRVQLRLSSPTSALGDWCTDALGIGCTVEEKKAGEWEEGELIRRSQNRVELRRPLRFEGTKLLDPDRIEELALWMDNSPTVGGIVIEGRATDGEEGARRAEEMGRLLIQAGVHPRQLSLRSSRSKKDEGVQLWSLPRADNNSLGKALPLPWDGSGPPAPRKAVAPRASPECPGLSGLPPARLLDKLMCSLGALDGAKNEKAKYTVAAPSDDTALSSWCRNNPQLRCALDASWKGDEYSLAGGRIRVPDPVAFASGQAKLLPEGEAVVRELVDTLKKHPEISGLVVEGNASSDGEFLENYRISAARARAVVDTITKAGIEPGRLSYRGLGEVAPLVSGDGAFAHDRNRRVEFFIYREGK